MFLGLQELVHWQTRFVPEAQLAEVFILLEDCLVLEARQFLANRFGRAVNLAWLLIQVKISEEEATAIRDSEHLLSRAWLPAINVRRGQIPRALLLVGREQ